MARFTLDAKAFLSFEIEAPNRREAREMVEAIIDSLSPTEPYVDGFNTGLNEPGLSVISAGSWDIDGIDIEEA